MEPIHITEFASDRYFEKLNQIRDAQAAPGGPSTQPQDRNALEASTPHGPFILPLRGAHAVEAEEAVLTRPVDQKVKEKSRFHLSFRTRILQSKSQTSSNTEQVERRPSVAESTKQSLPFDQLFLHLPNELQVQILCSLPLSDLLSMRRTSRSLHALIYLNESILVRHHLDRDIPAYARRLYPLPENAPYTLHYLCGIWHRLHVAAKLSDLMCEWITKDIFLRTDAEKKREFAPQRERMRRRLIPLLFTIFHFFESYREEHLKYIKENGYGLTRQPYTINPVEAKIMKMYDDRTLLKVHEVFPLVVSSFLRRLRPPTYVGTLEKTIRGYLKDKPADEVHVAALCIGGIRQVERFWEVKGYNTRRTAVDVWYNSITKDYVVEQQAEQKKKRGIMGLGRKKSTVSLGKQAASDSQHGRGSWDGSSTQGADSRANNYIFHTSLSAGMPMGNLPRDQLKILIEDLPHLHEIWLPTAEALILDRKIVERPSDIKRNHHLMMELIREDGVDEEDEWLYGTTASDSVRPNLAAIAEDTLE
ncbi:F-box domain-containing protein [Coniochaeta hoffmannii]|uniref:F-box domain-containing protein n=1 Tax=Coniochaeta hoffmannii TaxID=91930 RepID=A0AA38SCY6_9PEZI|nr:F-box domain-containing protein [Coniochaeta hoffmannii]